VHTPNQNKTDLEKAFDYLIERKIPAVNVVWATGRRADHTISNVTNIVRYQNELKIVILDDYSKIFQLPKKYQKWYPAKTILSLIPIGSVEGISSENLEYPLENGTLIINGMLGLIGKFTF
jgi:thiamine pyrophosphokinase